MSNIFDIGIIGVGVAGSFACLKLSKHKDLKVLAIELGRPPAKRRQQTIGFLGCLPNSDGKLYLSDLDKVSNVAGVRKTNAAFKIFDNVLSEIDSFKTIKDKGPSASINKKIKKAGYDIVLNDYIQMYPKDIHSLSKYIANSVEESNNITFSFDNEVTHIQKQKNIFSISTSSGQEFKCKKIIIGVGRAGWRWARDLYANFGIIDNNDTATFGIRIEANSDVMKEFNKSNCSIIKYGEWELGPLSWNGTVIPEDHLDTAISAFRSNENRWKTDKVSFSLIGSRYFENNGFEQTDRLSKLTFILANDRIIKERVSLLLNDKSKISVIPEYDWLKDTIKELSTIVPEIATKAYFHVPTILPVAPKINLGTNLESEVEGMYVVGESAGVFGILSSACMGIIAATEVCK